jgi:hypothetical protein
MQSSSLHSNWFSSPCLTREGDKSPHEIPLLNQLNKVAPSIKIESTASINKYCGNISWISRSRHLVLAYCLSLYSFTLHAQVANPITGTHVDTSGSINPIPKQIAQQQLVLNALAAAAEARQMMAIIEKMHNTKGELTSHPTDLDATNKLVKANEPKNERLTD